MKENKLLKFTTVTLILIYSICFILFLVKTDLFKLSLTVFCLISTFVLYKLHQKNSSLLTNNLYLITNLFIFFSTLLGSVFGFYSINHFDDFLHIWSGFISCSIAYSIIVNFKVLDFSNKHHILLLCIFVFMFNMGIASLWEIMEFLLDTFLGTHTQAGGLEDTVIDMIDAFIGGIIMTAYTAKKSYKLNKI